ncbi:MAG: RlmE family RNA methyltransferase [Pseudomonadota bacterium]
MAKRKSGPDGRSMGPSGGQRQLKVRVKTARRRSTSSTRWLQRQLNDPYVAAAKREGMRSRAAFKLQEIDDAHQILKPGHVVIDLGAAPGGWCQIAAHRVGAQQAPGVEGAMIEGAARVEEGAKSLAARKRKTGVVVGIDYLKVDPLPGVTMLHMDFTDAAAEPALLAALPTGRADVVLSDMAAPTVGHARTDHLRIIALAEAAAGFAIAVLQPGGSFLCKVFQGGTERDLLDLLKANFGKLRHVKPKASRADSSELYVLATGFHGGRGEA